MPCDGSWPDDEQTTRPGLALWDKANLRESGTMTSSAPSRPRRELDRLGPVEQLRAGRLGRRLSQLLVGLLLYGVTLAMIIRGTLGNAPWDVLHQGLAKHLPLSIGTAVIAVSLLVLLLWIPLREMPGLGTIANSFLVGLSADAALAVIAHPRSAVGAGPARRSPVCSSTRSRRRCTSAASSGPDRGTA